MTGGALSSSETRPLSCHPPKFEELTGDPVFCISGISIQEVGKSIEQLQVGYKG